MTANSLNHLQAVQWRQIGQKPLGNLRQFVVFIEQPNACGVMTHGEFSVWLRTERTRPKVQNLTLKSARALSNIMQSDECNETARKRLGIYATSFCEPLETQMFLPK